MGQECCQVATDESSFMKKAFTIKKYQFEPAVQFDKNIPILMSKIPEINQQNVFKHKQQNRFFIGNLQDNQTPSKGVLYIPETFLYQGNFLHGSLEGEGQITFLNRDEQYKGNFSKGRANGRGLYKNNKKHLTFQGEWQDSKPLKGILIFEQNPNITKIEIKDFLSGQAHISYKDGRQYEGQIDRQRFIPSGHGKLIFIDGSSYQGGWKNGVMHGKGIYEWQDGSKYEGDYFQNKKQGFGTFYYSSGKKYIGAWANGKQEGKGKMQTVNGELLKQGIWKNGKFQNNQQLHQQAHQNVSS